MIHTIRVQHTNVSFPCDSEQTVLDAAEGAGYVLPYSCRKGVCSTCAATLATGELSVRGHGIAIGPRRDVLLCQARPASDVVIVPSRIRSAEYAARKTLQATVHRIEAPATDVVVLQLRFANGIRAPFKAGQHLRVSLADGSTRNYSMANSPSDNDGVQLHIRRVVAGVFSDRALSSLTVGARIWVELPFGEVSMDTTLPLRAVLLATGTGFAPLKSMIEHQIKRRTTRPMHLFWGGRTEQDLYMSSLPESWAKRYPWFSFTPVLSAAARAWTGATGRVQDVSMTLYPDLSNAQVFACGSLAMVNTAKLSLCSHARLLERDFCSDAFVSSNLDEGAGAVQTRSA